MIANQLNTTNNMLSALIPSPVDGSVFYKYAGGYSGSSFDAIDNKWSADFTLAPGEGGFFKDPANGSGQVLTFVGEVLQGTLSNDLPAGQYAIRSSKVPQAASLKALGVPADDGDLAYVYNNGYATYSYDGIDNKWSDPSGDGPTINVGQGFFYKKAAAGTSTAWVRNFTVN
jgi:hypothetical protein